MDASNLKREKTHNNGYDFGTLKCYLMTTITISKGRIERENAGAEYVFSKGHNGNCTYRGWSIKGNWTAYAIEKSKNRYIEL